MRCCYIFQVRSRSGPGRFFLTIDTMHKVEKSREGKFIKIPPSKNANLTAGNVLVSLHYNCAFEGWEMLTFPP